MITVFLVTAPGTVRRGLTEILEQDPALTVVGGAADVAQARSRIPALRPDVAVLDARLPDGDGIELCRELLAGIDKLRCLILASYPDEQAMMAAMDAGASGYVVKDIKGMELASAIREIGAGRSLLDNRAGAALLARRRAWGVVADTARTTKHRTRRSRSA